MHDNQLAIHGGMKVKTMPYGSGKRFGEEEAKEVLEALEQNTLFYHHGKKVKQFLSDFNAMHGIDYSVSTSSGSAAIHVALGTAGVTVGDEVITSPITDQGTVIGILYQNAIPVFADLDAYGNLDPAAVEACVTPRTKAIVVVHLAGMPCDMDAIMEIANRHHLKVIEDCAQSYLARYKGSLVGTIGHYGCFSTNDFKHISTGDGGIVTINSGDWADYERTHAFADKNYQRFTESIVRDIQYVAPNYRMTELQGAVGIAQLKKLPHICETRNRHGEAITAGIRDLPGIMPPIVADGDWCSFWFYMLRIDESQFNCTRDEFIAALSAEGIDCAGGYVPYPVYMQPLFLNRQAYIGSQYPFDLTDAEYKEGLCPIAEEILRTSIRLPINEFHTDQDVAEVITGMRKVAAYYAK